MEVMLLDSDTKLKVSSVLNRDTRAYGKQYMLDGSEETCWNSDQGSPQYIIITLGGDRAACVHELQLMFQGGFVGKDCHIFGQCIGGGSSDFKKLCSFYPEDVNSMQRFNINTSSDASGPVNAIKIVFGASTDFFGRITVYKLALMGQWA